MSMITPVLVRLRRTHGAKALRYCGVSAVNVMVGMTMLALCYSVLGWPAVAANLAAWIVGTVPAYLLSRAWVWQQSGTHRMGSEMILFWMMALAGLVLSSVTVGLVDRYTDSALLVLAGNFIAYGAVWVAKYLFLDKVMWPSGQPVDVEAAGAVEAGSGR